MSYSSEVLADSPIIYLRLGDASGTTAVDSSGNSHDGTYSNSPTLGVTGALVGDTDKAVTFSGATQDVNVPFFSGLNITTFTLACWVKTTASNQAIIGRRGTTGAPYILLVDTTGKLQLTIKTTGTTGPNYNSTGVTINNGAWRFIVVTRDNATGDVKFYIDGVLDTTVTGTSAPGVATSNGFAVASRGGTPYLNGSVDEATLYGTALSAARIATLYAAGSGILAASASGSLSFSGTAAAVGGGSAAGAIALSGAGAAGAAAGAAGSISLTGAGGTVAPSPASASGSIALSGVGATGVGVAASGALDLSGSGSAAATLAASAAGSITLAGTGSATLAAAASGSITFGSVAAAFALYLTDLTNALNGRRRRGRAAAWVDRPAAAPPGRALGVRYDKAIAYPVPTMVDGRPT